MTGWVEQIERRARLIHSEIANMRLTLAPLGVDAEKACARYYSLLDEMYGHDLPLARAKDNSDLLLHIEGRAVEGAPRLSLVSSVFDNVKVQVRDLTKVIAGIIPDRRIGVGEIDLGLSGLAKGSLFIGFSVPLPREKKGQPNLLGGEDGIYKATKDALRIIDTVSHTIDSSEVENADREVSEAVSDPKVRDAALVAVRRIAPSNRMGVSSVGVSSGEGARKPANLTSDTRRQLGLMLRSPVTSTEVITLQGRVREIDLDARRFELRGITDGIIQDIRCAYSEVRDVRPKSLLDATVRVSGTVERRPDAAPRLMALTEVTVLSGGGVVDEPTLL